MPSVVGRHGNRPAWFAFLVLALVLLPTAVAAAPVGTRIGGGSSRLALGADLAAVFRARGVVLVRTDSAGHVEPFARSAVDLAITSGTLSHSNPRARGSIDFHGGFALIRPGEGRAVVTRLTADLNRQTLYGAVDGGPRTALAVMAGLRAAEAPRDVFAVEAGLEVTADTATALNAALGTEALADGDVLFDWEGRLSPALLDLASLIAGDRPPGDAAADGAGTPGGGRSETLVPEAAAPSSADPPADVRNPPVAGVP